MRPFGATISGRCTKTTSYVRGEMLIVGPDARELLQASSDELRELGYEPDAPVPEPPARSKRTDAVVQPLELRATTGKAGACLALRHGEILCPPAPEALAIGLAPRLALRLGRPLEVFTARLVFQGDDWDLHLTHRDVATDGSFSPGRLQDSLVEAYGSNWDDICDGKPVYAVNAILEIAELEMIGESHPHAFVRCEPPPSIGTSRLDALAQQIRFAHEVSVTTVGGRRAVRMASGGSTSISVVEDDELEALGVVLGST